MPAISGEPFRALSKVKIDDGLGNRRSFTASVDSVTPDTATGNQASWLGTPGSSLTLTFKWDETGVPVPGIANAGHIHIRVPGDANNIGTDWDVTMTTPSGSVTKTFRFAADPMGATPGANMAGMVEVRLRVERSAAVAWGPLDSRGLGDGTAAVPTGNTFTWARGYLRAPVTISSFTISNAALADTEPGLFAFPDSTFNQVILDAAWYRSAALTLAHRQAATDRRTEANAATTATRSFTWNTTATTVAGKGRINNGQYGVAATATDVRITLPSTSFGGSADKEYSLAASGHISTWTRLDESNLEKTARITVDPRLTLALPLYINNATYTTPPMAGDTTSGQRLDADLGFVSARARNARNTDTSLDIIDGVLAWTEKLWDIAELTGNDVSPTQSRPATTATKGGERGWSDAMLTWDKGRPGGGWVHKVTITTPDAVGLELTNTRTLTLLAADPRIQVSIGAGDPTAPGRHWSPGQQLTLGVSISSAGVKQSFDAGTAKVMLLRFAPALGTVEYLTAGLTWVTGDTYDQFTMTPSAGDAKIVIKTFTAAQTAGWNTEDLFVICLISKNSVQYSGSAQMPVLGTKLPHDVNAPESMIVYNIVSGHHHDGIDSRIAVGSGSPAPISGGGGAVYWPVGDWPTEKKRKEEELVLASQFVPQ